MSVTARLTDGDDTASTTASSRGRFAAGYDAIASQAAAFVAKPVQEVQQNMKEAISIKLFWGDMDRRERTGFHKATLIVGLLQAVVIVVYSVMLEAHHLDTVIDYRYLNFVVVEVLIASAAQVVYSLRGICLENSPMLLVANINSMFLAVRIGLTASIGMQSLAVDATFVALYSLLAVLHVAVSYVAWGGEFSRFMSFCIGADSHVQEMFRQYQLLGAVGSLDMQLCVMTAAALLFFVETHWWHYVLVAVVLFVNLALRSLLRRVVREEKPKALLFVLPYDVAYTVFVIVALYNSSVLGASIEGSCLPMTTFTVCAFCVVRFCVYAALYRCYQNFGSGMVDAFAAQKSSTDFLLSLHRRYRPKYITDAASAANA